MLMRGGARGRDGAGVRQRGEERVRERERESERVC